MEESKNISEWKNVLFDLIVESTPSLLLTVDAVGTILFINHAAEKLFGYKEGELIGQPIEILVPERFRQTHVLERNQYLHAPEARPMGRGRDLYGRRKDGSEFPVEISLNPKVTDKGAFVLAVAVDISERKRSETERERLLAKEREARKSLEKAKWKDEFLLTSAEC